MSPAPARIVFLLSQVGAQAARSFAAAIAPLEISPAHAGLLRAVAAQPGRSQQAVAAQLGVLPSTLVALVDHLQARGAITRTRATSDRRQYALNVSEDGHALLAQIASLAQDSAAHHLAALDDDDQQHLAQALQALAGAWDLEAGIHPGYRTMTPP